MFAMAYSLKSSVCVAGLNEATINSKIMGVSVFPKSFGSLLQIAELRPKAVMSVDSVVKSSSSFSVHTQASTCVSRALRWWDKTPKPNMVDIHSAIEFFDSLLNAGDRLVVVDFYSPGCGGCKALHPKICQLAESHPDAIFLKVNYEEHKTMCQSLHIHVLPFFRFYRGAEGRLCSFSCTNATIKKFKDALAKHGTDRCSLGPAKGLDESEIIKLASVGELPINLPIPSNKKERVEDLVTIGLDLSMLRNKGKTALV